jgi:uncharacterized protein (DUF488 family)
MQTKNDPPSPSTPVSVGRLFSVGHSNQELSQFMALLRGPGVNAVADVRTSPYSRRLPRFNRAALERELKQIGIAYVYLGDLLGGRPRERDLYDEAGCVDYERIRTTAPFRRGLERLWRGLERHAVALMCCEDDPLDCHRGLLITPAVKEEGRSPLHLRKDGTVETTEAMERRLLRETGTAGQVENPLFGPLLTDDDRRAVLAEAYRLMGRRKAFRLEEE